VQELLGLELLVHLPAAEAKPALRGQPWQTKLVAVV